MNKKQIAVPKYVLEGNQNIPEDLKKVKDYFRDCGNKNYLVCLVGEKESVAKDLKEKGFKDKYPFIHLDNQSLNEEYPFLPISVKNAIRRINILISNPDNDFNKTNLGIHTLGLVRISEIKTLNELGYGLTSWNGVKIYDRQLSPCTKIDNSTICCITSGESKCYKI